MLPNLKVLLDTNVCIERERHHLLQSSVATLFQTMLDLGIKYVLHYGTYTDIERYQNVTQKAILRSKLSCYPLLTDAPDPSADDDFLNIVGSPIEPNDEVDNALLYAVYKGAASHLVTEDSKRRGSIHAKAQRLGIRDRVLSINEAIAEFKKTANLSSTFLAWEDARNEHMRAKALSADVEFTGRANELPKICSMVDDPDIKATILLGLHGIGKTRLALEATKHRKNDTYMVDVGTSQSFSLEDLRLSKVPLDKASILLVEDPNRELAERLLNELDSQKNIRLLITSPDYVHLPPRDNTRTVVSERILPLSEKDARELLAAAPSKLQYNVISWLVQNAQGIPGVLLEGARTLSGRRKDVSDFASEMGKEAERSVREILDDDEIKKLHLLSLLKSVGVKKSAFADIVAICDSFGKKKVLGKDIDAASVVAALPKLQSVGIIRLKGLHVEIQSQFLANRLAKKLIRLHKKAFVELFRALDLTSQLQLIGRLQGIGTSFDHDWQFLFRKKGLIKGPLCDFQTAISNSPLLYPVACAHPRRVLGLIDNGLKRTTTETRKTITGDARRQLVWTLEELLFHRETSAKAILDLGLLAEAEVENYGNNATGVFCSYFFPRHPQASWPFSERLEVLEKILFTPDYSAELRGVGITAIESSLHHMAQPIVVHSSDAAAPLDPPFEHLEGQYLDYIEDLIDILMKIAQDEKEALMLAEQALVALPRANVESMIPVLRLTSPARRLERTIARFERLVEWATTGVRVSVSDLDAALKRCHNLLDKEIAKRGKITLSEIKNSSGFNEASDDEIKVLAADVERSIDRLQQYAHQIQTLIRALDQAAFAIRLKKWVGARRSPAEYGGGAQRDELRKIPHALANEALANPLLLTGDAELLAWLCSDEAKKAGVFFEELGKLDTEHCFIDVIERFGALDTRQSVENFASYYAGLNEVDDNFVSAQLDKFIEERQIQMEAILGSICPYGAQCHTI